MYIYIYVHKYIRYASFHVLFTSDPVTFPQIPQNDRFPHGFSPCRGADQVCSGSRATAENWATGFPSGGMSCQWLMVDPQGSH